MRRPWRWCAWSALACACACAWLATRPVPVRLTWSAQLAAPPDTVAHLLADFGNQPRLLALPLAWWRVGREETAVGSWSYEVRYGCAEGGCAGRASLLHRWPRPPHLHALDLRRSQCRASALPLWPDTCDERRTLTLLSAQEAGTLLHETAEVWCAALLARPCLARLAEERRLYLRRLRHLLLA